MKQKSIRWLKDYTPSYDQFKKLTHADKFFLDVIDRLAEVIGSSEFVQEHHILPHFSKAGKLDIVRNLRTFLLFFYH